MGCVFRPHVSFRTGFIMVSYVTMWSRMFKKRSHAAWRSLDALGYTFFQWFAPPGTPPGTPEMKNRQGFSSKVLPTIENQQGFSSKVLPGELPRELSETSPEISAERCPKVPPESSAETSPNNKKQQGF